MSIPIAVKLDGDPLPNRALWLQDGQKDIWVVTDAGGTAEVDDAYAGVALRYGGPVLFGGIETSKLSASGGSLWLQLEKGWTVPDSIAPTGGNVAVAVMNQNDMADLTKGGYLVKNHKVFVEVQSSARLSIDVVTDGNGYAWLPDSYVGETISLSAAMANDDQYGGGWFQVCDRGSIGTMYALWDVLDGG